MRRRSSDLLDVFRAPAAAPARPSKAHPAPNRRVRLALGATIGALSVLLVTLAVTGLSRKGGTSQPPPALASLRRGEWVIRAETPIVSSAGARDLRGLLPRELVGRFPELKDRLKLAPGETKASMKVIVTGFRTKTEAERALGALSVWSLESSFPFRRGVVVEVE